MAKRKILVLAPKNSPWVSFFQEFFEDTPSELLLFNDSLAAGSELSKSKPDIVFLEDSLISKNLELKFKAYLQAIPDLRVFHLGPEKNLKKESGIYRHSFLSPDNWSQFQKQLVTYLPLPDTLNIVIADDEIQVAGTLREYLEGLSQPSFQVQHAENGKRALSLVEKKLPDVLVLDIKMPMMTGREVYEKITSRGINIPVIVFFDSIIYDDVEAIRRCGNPAVVEKGSDRSSVAEMAALIKKMAYFG